MKLRCLDFIDFLKPEQTIAAPRARGLLHLQQSRSGKTISSYHINLHMNDILRIGLLEVLDASTADFGSTTVGSQSK